MRKDERFNENGKRREILFILVFFIFSVLAILLAIFCFKGTNTLFVKRHFVLLSWLTGVLIGLIFGLSIFMVLKQKETLIKTSLSVYIFLLFCLLLVLILQKTGFFEVVQNADRLQNYLEKAGLWMPLLYILLQYLQVVVLPIPSIVSTVAGVAIFGAFWTMIYSLVGILLGSITAFFIGRKLGYKAVSWMVGRETLDKWQKKLKGKDNFFLTVMFILPLFPDDVLCFIAGLSSMSIRYFLIMVLFSRVLAVATTCYSINFIPINTWWGATLWTLFIVGIIISFVWIYKNMDKLQSVVKRLKTKRKDK